MVDSLNCSYDYGELSDSQKEAIITLIQKKGKDKRHLSNWRPISLINVDVKIGSKAIAKRLENVLPNIIHHNHCAYVKGRTIFDAVRTIEDVMEFSERYNIEGKMICIDFKKAFDTVSRNFFISYIVCLWFWTIIYTMDPYLFLITFGVVSLIMVFLPSPSQLKEVLDKETLFPLFCLLWFQRFYASVYATTKTSMALWQTIKKLNQACLLTTSPTF